MPATRNDRPELKVTPAQVRKANVSRKENAMKAVMAALALSALAVSPSAFAQSSATSNQAAQTAPSATAGQSSNQNGSNLNAAATQKIRQDLTSAGFTDVNVVAESFVVQAKTKDGNPVVMTIGPHGMSVFEAMNVGGTASSGNTTGSNTGSSTGSGNSTVNIITINEVANDSSTNLQILKNGKFISLCCDSMNTHPCISPTVVRQNTTTD